MNAERSTVLVVALLMLLVGAVAWRFQLRPPLQVDATPLANLPTQIEGWSSHEISLDQNVESILRADFNVQRAFLHPLGDVVWLYIGYYGTDRGGTPEHTPRACYRAHGWSLSDFRTLVVDPPRGLRANEAVVELEGERRLLLFWYRSHRRTGILGTFALRVDHLLGRLTEGHADGALVRLSTPLDEGGSLPPGVAWCLSRKSSTPRSSATGPPKARSGEGRPRSQRREALSDACNRVSNWLRLKGKQSVTGVTGRPFHKTDDPGRRLRGGAFSQPPTRPAEPRGQENGEGPIVPFFVRILENSARLVFLCIAGLALGVASTAQARIETLRWLHDAPPEVSGFRVYVGSASNTYTQVVPAGLPPLNSDGTRSYDLQVADDATVYVAVSAYNSAGESGLSDEQMRAPASSGTCTPLDCDDSNACTSDGCDPVLGCQNTPISCNDGDVCTADSCDPVQGCQNTPISCNDGDVCTADSCDPVQGCQHTIISCDEDGVVFDTDFESEAIGNHVPNWVDTRAGNSLVEDDSLFGVTTLSGDRAFTTTSTQSGIHSHYVGSDSADWYHYEFRGRLRRSSSDAGLGVTTYSGFTSQDVYYRFCTHQQTREMELYRHPGPDGTFSCSTRNTGVIPQANVWYSFRFQVIPEDGRTRIRAKVWPESDAEPANWQAECNDTAPSRPSSGTIGFWSASGGAKWWDDLQVIALPGGMGPGGSTETLGRPGQPQIILP